MRSFKIIDHPESEKIVIEKKVEKEAKHGIPYAAEKIELHFASQWINISYNWNQTFSSKF